MSSDRSRDSLDSSLSVYFSMTGEQYNELLHMLAKVKLSNPRNRTPDETGKSAGDSNQDEVVDMEVATNGVSGDGASNVPIVIYRYQLKGRRLQINLVEKIQTNVVADNCQSWGDLSQNILTIWRQRNQAYNLLITNVAAANCWLGAETIFGSRFNGIFHSMNWPLIAGVEQSRRDVNCLIVIENVNWLAESGVPHTESESDEDDDNVMIGDGRIRTFLYQFRHQQMEMTSMGRFTVTPRNGAFESWNDVARECYRLYLAIKGYEPNTIGPVDVDIANCWPGADTIFGCRVGSRFQSLSWQHYAWDDVRHQLNFLLLIRY